MKKGIRIFVVTLIFVSMVMQQVAPLHNYCRNVQKVYAEQSDKVIRKKLKKCEKQLSEYRKQLKEVKSSLERQTRGLTYLFFPAISNDPLIVKRDGLFSSARTYYWINDRRYVKRLGDYVICYVRLTGDTRTYNDGYSSYTCSECNSVNVTGSSKKYSLEKKISKLKEKKTEYKWKLKAKLHLKKLCIYAGQTKKIIWYYDDCDENVRGKDLKWKSKDTSIATVDQNGRVTGVSAGTTKIVATTKVNKKTASATVVVEPNTPVETLQFQEGEKYLNTDTEYKLQYSVYPENADIRSIKWESSDNGIADIYDDGTLRTYSKDGTCEITLTINETEVAKCKIIVQNAELFYKSADDDKYYMTYSQQHFVNCIGDEIELAYGYTKKGSYQDPNEINMLKEGTWTTSDSNIAVVSGAGIICVNDYGPVRISVTDSNGVTIEEEICIVRDPNRVSSWYRDNED